MATTTNYSWSTPDDTALVKDGAAAIRTLGSSVDTTTKALNPSTTLGDIEYRSSTANTNTRLGIGTTGQVLTVTGGLPAWQTVSAGSMTLLASGSIAASATGIDVTSISASYKDLVLYIDDFSANATAASAGALMTLDLNNDTGTSYNYAFIRSNNSTPIVSNANTFIRFSEINSTNDKFAAVLKVFDYANTNSYKNVQFNCINDTTIGMSGNGAWFGTPAAVNRISVKLNAGAFTGGTYQVYGVN